MLKKIVLLDIEFHFGLGFLTELYEATGITLLDIENKVKAGDVTIYRSLMYYSRLYSVKRKNETPNFDIYAIDDLIDDNGGIQGKFLMDFATAFWTSVNGGVPVDDKKKVVTSKKK